MAVIKDITVDQGTNHIEGFTLESLTDTSLPYDEITNPYLLLDLAAATIRMQVRSTIDASSIMLTATDANGKFIKTTSGSFELHLLPLDTSAMRFSGEEANYVYDIELELPGPVTIRPVQGAFNVIREVTR
jgi:hypothetical protein